MILYHGSLTDFSNFEIQRGEDSRHDITSLREGYGIYLIESPEFAKSYGNILYTVECNKNDIIDFTKKSQIIKLVNELEHIIKIPLSRLVDIQDIADSIVGGHYAASNLIDEIIDLLDSQEDFYMKYQNSIDNGLFDNMRDIYESILPSITKYYDKSFKSNVYVCTKNESVLKIINKEFE